MSGNGTYIGAILAAGPGSRLGPFGETVPKPIVPICNRPLMAYQLDYMKAAGIEDVYIVIGHLGHLIVQALGDGSDFGVRIHYVEQEKRLGLAHAVGQLEPYMDRPFVLMLGDIFFDLGDLGDLIREFEKHEAAAALAAHEETDPERVKRNFSIHPGKHGDVKRVIEKPRHVTSMLKDVGVYVFDLPIFDAIRRTPRTAMRNEYELTDSIQILIDLEYTVRAAPIVEWDMNVTYAGDLITCNLHQLAKLGQPSLVGADCAIVDGTTLSNTVVGDRVVITRPVTLERCVVLPGSRLEDGSDLCETVVAGARRLAATPSLEA